MLLKRHPAKVQGKKGQGKADRGRASKAQQPFAESADPPRVCEREDFQ